MTNDTQKAQDHLSKHDPKLAAVIKKYGPYLVVPHNRYYQELVEAIIGQQLSVKAAATITKRFVELFDGEFPTPQQIIAKPHDKLRSAGLSNAKANYVRDLAAHVIDGRLQIDSLQTLDNQQVVQELTAVKGIGEWTAHMFLIFSLGRLDVLPVGDLGLRVGVQKLYDLPSTPLPADVTKIALEKSWAPYQSVATWYIWKSLDN